MKTNYVLKNPPNPASFSTTDKVGGVAGCTGATTGVQGAASNAGSQYMLKGGTNFYGFKNANAALTGSMKGSYAPISKGSHNKCGGRKSRRRSHKKARKTRHRRKSNHHRRKAKHHRRKSKHHRRKSKRRTYKRRRNHRGGYSQYLSNVPMAHGYSTGGNISPVNNALANPVPYKAYNHCQKGGAGLLATTAAGAVVDAGITYGPYIADHPKQVGSDITGLANQVGSGVIGVGNRIDSTLSGIF